MKIYNVCSSRKFISLNYILGVLFVGILQQRPGRLTTRSCNFWCLIRCFVNFLMTIKVGCSCLRNTSEVRQTEKYEDFGGYSLDLRRIRACWCKR